MKNKEIEEKDLEVVNGGMIVMQLPNASIGRKAACPFCGKDIEKSTFSDTVCPHCKNTVKSSGGGLSNLI